MGGQDESVPSYCSIEFEHRHLSKLDKEMANAHPCHKKRKIINNRVLRCYHLPFTGKVQKCDEDKIAMRRKA
jgi:hypothetical protein